MTEEFKSMCRTVTEMAKEELDPGRDGCFLMFAFENGDAGAETVKAAFGKTEDLCTAITMAMLSIVESMPAMVRAAFIISAMQAALKHCGVDQKEEQP